MNNQYGKCSLFLCPKQADVAIDDNPKQSGQALATQLRTIGFIAEPIDADTPDSGFFTGPQFLNLVAYMGCAPAIQFETSQENPDFCFIRIHRYDNARLIVSNKLLSPLLCPKCGERIDGWQQHLSSTSIYCTRCLSHSAIDTFNWRKMGGYAQLFIEVTDVFPREAVPQSLLLEKLASMSNTPWQYFYSCR